jgi:hypothetical protein
MRDYTGWRRTDVHRARYRMQVEAEARRQLAPKPPVKMTSGKWMLVYFAVFGFIGLEIGGLSNHDSGGAALIGLVIGLGVAAGIAMLAKAATSPNQPVTRQAPRTPPLTESEKGHQPIPVEDLSDEQLARRYEYFKNAGMRAEDVVAEMRRRGH